MGEKIKNSLIVVLAILSAIFFLGTLRSCGASNRLKAALTELDKEKSASWDSEQKITEFKKENDGLKKELEGAKAENEAVKKALMQEQLISQSLKEELEKASKLKDKLEDNLKDALTQDKPEPQK